MISLVKGKTEIPPDSTDASGGFFYQLLFADLFYLLETFEKLNCDEEIFQLTRFCVSEENSGVVNCNCMILFKDMPLDKKFWKKSGGV